jgi:ATP-dependent DNA helicase RecG
LEPGVSFRVVFEITTQETTPKTTPITTPKTTSIILQMIKENPKVSIADLIEAIGDITIDGVKYHFRELKKQGKIERIGSSRSGYWKIVK